MADTLAVSCGNTITNVASYIIYFIVLLILCHGLHILLKPLSQPRIISETIVGLFIGNLAPVRKLLKIDRDPNNPGLRNMKFLTDFGMTGYMFALGLEMDPSVLFHIPGREAIVAYTGMFFTFVLTSVTTPFLHYAIRSNVPFILAFSVILSSTGSPLLTRVLTDLKIGKSGIGKFAISAAVYSELVTTLIICIGDAIFKPDGNFQVRKKDPNQKGTLVGQSIVTLAIALAAQVFVTLVAGPVILSWVNSANPHGKTFKGSHLVLSVAFVVSVGCISPLVGFSPLLSAFITGVFLPREGRISHFIVTRVNYFLSFMFYPFFFVWVGLEAEFGRFEALKLGSWARLFGLFGVATTGKIIGSLVSGFIFGFDWPKSISLALLLNVKGHLHIYLTILAVKNDIITYSTCISMILAMLLKIIYIPMVARYIIQRAKKRAPNTPMGLHWHDPTKELRILIGLHGPEDVSWAINFMQMIKGVGDSGIVAYATDMIELTDQIAATLAPGGDGDCGVITDQEVNQMRQKISDRLKEYTGENGNGDGDRDGDGEGDGEGEGEGVGLKRMLVLSTFNSMPQEICHLAEDSMISLMVLPFHNGQSVRSGGDGKTMSTMSEGHTGFRYVNKKVFRLAPCSVAIMVDRGFGAIKQISRKTGESGGTTLNAVVIFIGGKDDREALAYAGLIAYDERVKLTVMRFLVDTSDVETTVKRTTQQEEEMRSDDECFANFYEQQVAGGKVAYMEKHLVNSAQAYSTLRSLEGQYGLFIIGRGGRVNSMLTVGMNDWEQCPELGPLGDILSGPNFSTTASVLIIQQHNPKSEPGGAADNEFSIM